MIMNILVDNFQSRFIFCLVASSFRLLAQAGCETTAPQKVAYPGEFFVRAEISEPEVEKYHLGKSFLLGPIRPGEIRTQQIEYEIKSMSGSNDGLRFLDVGYPNPTVSAGGKAILIIRLSSPRKLGRNEVVLNVGRREDQGARIACRVRVNVYALNSVAKVTSASDSSESAAFEPKDTDSRSISTEVSKSVWAAPLSQYILLFLGKKSNIIDTEATE